MLKNPYRNKITLLPQTSEWHLPSGKKERISGWGNRIYGWKDGQDE